MNVKSILVVTSVLMAVAGSLFGASLNDVAMMTVYMLPGISAFIGLKAIYS